jgi:hypothetical protein
MVDDRSWTVSLYLLSRLQEAGLRLTYLFLIRLRPLDALGYHRFSIQEANSLIRRDGLFTVGSSDGGPLRARFVWSWRIEEYVGEGKKHRGERPRIGQRRC